MTKPRILVFVAYYLPGYKAGGPLRTIENMVERLHDQFEFRIVTRDRDVDDCAPYSGVQVATWQKVGNAYVYYLPENELISLGSLRHHIDTFEFDIVYLNSHFDTTSIVYLLLRRLRLIPRTPLIIAPRGELSTGALSLKSFKKRFYIVLAKILGLFGDVKWQASSMYEKNEIRSIYSKANVHIASNLPPKKYLQYTEYTKPYKQPNTARLIYISRITPKKQLHFALELLSQLDKPVQFDIYGPIRDKKYWFLCEQIIGNLPSHIKVTYRGSIPYEKVVSTFSEHHFFFFPTLSENYGHVILEALVAGCPVLTSNGTPWRHLEEKEIGWDIEASNHDVFLIALEQIITMNNVTFQRWSSKARLYGQAKLEAKDEVEANRILFQHFP